MFRLFKPRSSTDNYSMNGVLVVGRTGAGKSSLINAIIGHPIAITEGARPVTKRITPFTHENLPFFLYDSPGWEEGKQKAKDYIKNSQNHLKYLHDKVKLIWYVIDAPSTRLYDFEVTLLKTVFNNLPVFFVITKCDIATDEQINGLLSAIIAANVSNQSGAFQVGISPSGQQLEPRFDISRLIQMTQQSLNK